MVTCDIPIINLRIRRSSI